MMTRDEAFEEMLGVIARLQGDGALSFERVQELNAVICRYGSACAHWGAELVRSDRDAAR
jgi:hypothetical protein